MRRLPLFVFVLVLSALGFACDADDDRQVLLVYAASSLKDAFEELEEAFERENPGVDIRLNFAGSQVLRLQIEQGAPADVYASANEDHMAALQRAGFMGDASIFASNSLALIVPQENPAGIARFEELSDAQRLVVGTGNVPVGEYTEALLKDAEKTLGAAFREAVTSSVVSRESNVRLVRGKVELGEADAAIVYRTDAVSSDAVGMIDIPSELNQVAHYPMAVASGSKNESLARSWVHFVQSPAGQRILTRHGFQTVR